MKKFYIACLCLFVAAGAFAQKKEKIKGSKVVTVTQKEVQPFDALEIEDNLEIYLVKGATQAIEIEADDNLHESITSEMYGTTLRLATSKQVTGAKKLSVRVTYTDNLKLITAKHESVINALADLDMPVVAVKNLDYSKSYLNVKAANFSLSMNDKTKAEINVKSDTTSIDLSKNADLKALIASTNVKIDLYQKANAAVEGDAANAKLRVDNNSTFTGKRFNVKNLELVAESYTTASVMAIETASITATGKAEVQLLGKPKVTIPNFADSAVIYKKEQ